MNPDQMAQSMAASYGLPVAYRKVDDLIRYGGKNVEYWQDVQLCLELLMEQEVL